MRFALLTLLLAACGHTSLRAPLTTPDHGGPAWTGVDSPHFRVRTDQSTEVALRTSRTLEEAYAAFEKLFGVGMVSRAAPVGRVDLVAFERKEDFVAVSRSEHASAIFYDPQIELEPQPTIVTWGPLGPSARATLQHELAHRFVRHTIRFLPTWLNEGLAEYFSTFELYEGVARFGKRPAYGRIFGAERLPPLEKLLSLDRARFYDQQDQSANYMAAWALVHYLEHTPDLRPRFRDYQRRLAEGEEPRPAFDAAFEGIDRARIDREFREQAVAPGVAVLEGRFTAPASASDAWRRLDPSDVHLLFARLLWSPRNLTRIRAEIDEAASLAPASGAVANLRAWLELRLGHPMAAENAARRAVTLAPSEPGFQFTLAQALYSTIRTWPAPHNWKPLRALLKPLWPAATSAGSLNLIAWLYAEMGEPDMAQPFARKAVDTDPACYQCLDTLARVLEDTGFVEEALPIEERALALLPEQIKLMSLVKRLDRLREKVQAAKAVP